MRGDEQLLAGLTQSSLPGRLASLDHPAGEAHLAGLPLEVEGALLKEHVDAAVRLMYEGDEHRRAVQMALTPCQSALELA